MLPISILALVAPVVAVPLASFEGFGFKAFAEDGGWSARLDVTNQAGISEGQVRLKQKSGKNIYRNKSSLGKVPSFLYNIFGVFF